MKTDSIRDTELLFKRFAFEEFIFISRRIRLHQKITLSIEYHSIKHLPFYLSSKRDIFNEFIYLAFNDNMNLEFVVRFLAVD